MRKEFKVVGCLAGVLGIISLSLVFIKIFEPENELSVKYVRENNYSSQINEEYEYEYVESNSYMFDNIADDGIQYQQGNSFSNGTKRNTALAEESYEVVDTDIEEDLSEEFTEESKEDSVIENFTEEESTKTLLEQQFEEYFEKLRLESETNVEIKE